MVAYNLMFMRIKSRNIRESDQYLCIYYNVEIWWTKRDRKADRKKEPQNAKLRRSLMQMDMDVHCIQNS